MNMKINNINNVNFKSVYGLYGTAKHISKIYTEILKTNQNHNILFLSATDEYVSSKNQDSILSKEAKNGKEVAFFITGEKDSAKARFMESGYGSINGISQHLDKVFDADNILEDEKEEIINSMYE